ncbi:unnamed protein product, partial [Didymodactylos carnosus]
MRNRTSLIGAYMLGDRRIRDIYHVWVHLNPELNTGPFTIAEDAALLQSIKVFQMLNPAKKIQWTTICDSVPNRSAPQCRQRYGYLRSANAAQPPPEYTNDLDDKLFGLAKLYPSNWVRISSEMDGIKITTLQQRYRKLVRSMTLEQWLENQSDTTREFLHLFYSSTSPWSTSNKRKKTEQTEDDIGQVHLTTKQIQIIDQQKQRFLTIVTNIMKQNQPIATGSGQDRTKIP